MFFGDADPLVLDRNPDVFPLFEVRPALFGQFQIFQDNAYCSAVGHGVLGVDDEVFDHLADLPGVHFGLPQILWDGTFALHVGPAQREFGGVFHQLPDQGRLSHRSTPPGKGEELAGKSFGPHRCLLGLPDDFHQFLISLALDFYDGKVGDHSGEDVVEIMSDTPRQKSERFEFVRFKQLLLHPLVLGNIPHDVNRPGHIAVPVHPGSGGHQETPVQYLVVHLNGMLAAVHQGL